MVPRFYSNTKFHCFDCCKFFFRTLALAAKDGTIAEKDQLLAEKDKEIKALAYHIGRIKTAATWMIFWVISFGYFN